MHPISSRGFRFARRPIQSSGVSKSVKATISEVAGKAGSPVTLRRERKRDSEQVNKKVGESLASAIETGEKATEKTQEAFATTKRTKDEVRGAKEKTDAVGQKLKKAGK